MKQVEEPCPRCESPQKFAPQIRDVDGCDWQELYIRCTMCRHETVLRPTTREIEHLRRMLAKLAKKAQEEINRHDTISSNTSSAISRQRNRINQALRELQDRIDRHGRNT